jgi:hypothetical protein
MPRRQSGHQTNTPMQQQRRRCSLATCRTTFVIPVTSKRLLQAVVCSWHVRHVGVIEQTPPITAAHLHVVIHCIGQQTGRIAVPFHGTKQTTPLLSNDHAHDPLLSQDVSDLMGPPQGPLH